MEPILETEPKILVVDDDPLILKTITAYLEHNGYNHREASTGTSALSIIKEYEPDYIILDLMLPGMSGREVLKELRYYSDSHVTVLSALGDETDKVALLSEGADDYIVKPFSPRELIARIEAYLRRRDRKLKKPDIVNFGPITVDRGRREVRSEETILDLTPIEYDILCIFLDSEGRVISRNRLIQLVWGDDFFIDERAVDVHIRRLRLKIEKDPSDPRVIVTSRGAGYKWGDMVIWYS